MPDWIFAIDKSLSDKASALVIRLVEDKSLRPLSVESIRSSARGLDLQALDFLIKEDQRVKKNNSAPEVSPTLLYVGFAQTAQALKLLAATGKLTFNNKRLVCDLFGRAEFYYEVAIDGSGKPIVSGRIRSHEKNFNLQECDFVCGGPPVWFIKGISLKFVGTSVPWSTFKELAQKTADPSCLPDDDTEDRDDTDPKIVYQGNAKEVLFQIKEPLPLLYLKDRTGAFADLWMDYGQGKLVPFRDSISTLPQRLKRQKETEKSWEKDLLETEFYFKPMPTSSYYCPIDKVAKSLCFLLEIGWTIKDWKGNTLVHPKSAELTIESREKAIEIKGTIRFGEHSLQVSDVVGAFTKRERFVDISPGMIGLIPPDLRSLGLSGLDDGEITGSTIRFRNNQIGALADLLATDKVKTDEDIQKLKERISAFTGLSEALPSPAFIGTLRPYQQEGVNWLNFLYEYGFHGILADDMGLGKTIQTLAFFSRFLEEGPILIIVPTSLLFNWKREIEQFLPEASVYLHHGPLREKNGLETKKRTIILTSYATLRLDINSFSKQSYACVVLDEAQTIKNPHTQIAQAIFSLSGKFRLSITGTPIENHLTELWSQFHFLMPDLLGPEKDFSSDVLASAADSRYLTRIRKQIKPFILRRKKEEVAQDLPEIVEQTIWIEMPASQQEIYDNFLAGIKGNLLKKVESDGIAKHRMEILEALLRLRQICCHPLLVSKHMDENTQFESAKLETLLLDLENIVEENRKALVYSQFTGMLHILAKKLREMHWEFAYLDGQTVEREKEVEKFQKDPNIRIFLVSLKAGGVGLNLTAADTVILYDPWWNDAVERQAISRAHRIGRKDTVFAKRYIVQESIEEKMMKLKAAKQSLIQDVLSSEEPLAAMTQEDFTFLFS
jgi:SNF2 family DNA or RNA helicase